jgi:hypothetical protein
MPFKELRSIIGQGFRLGRTILRPKSDISKLYRDVYQGNNLFML